MHIVIFAFNITHQQGNLSTYMLNNTHQQSNTYYYSCKSTNGVRKLLYMLKITHQQSKHIITQQIYSPAGYQ